MDEPKTALPPLDEWPFPERRTPIPNVPDYLGFKGLSETLQRVVAERLGGKTGLNVLDVGCGKKPFYPFLAPHAGEYIGTEIFEDELIDRVCPAEALDVEDNWADVAMCLSVLEHVNDPRQSVRELLRVVKPDGMVFASTHGCFPWHPYPQDHWRWTQTGLKLMFEQEGFTDVELFSTRGTMSGMCFLLAHYFWNWTSTSAFRRAFRVPVQRLINGAGVWLDKKTPGLANVNRHVSAIPEFFVIAKP